MFYLVLGQYTRNYTQTVKRALFHIPIDNAFRCSEVSVLWRRLGVRGQSHRMKLTITVNPASQGFKSGDFAPAKYYSSLDWLDRRSGLMYR